MFNNSCAKYIFKFDTTTQSWKAYVADGEDYGYEGENITSLNRTDGFWAMGNENPCSIKINDKPNTILPDGTPYIITSDKLDIVENETEVIMLLSKGSTSAVTYSLAGGNEHRFFTIDSTSGLLTFKEKPDYENPQDLGLDNTYEVKVSVSNGDLKSEKTLNINIIDRVNEEFSFVNRPYEFVIEKFGLKYCPKMEFGEGDISYEIVVTDKDNVTKYSTFSDGCLKFQSDDVGEYNIYIKATDANDNIAEENFTFTNEIRTVLPYKAVATISDITFDARSNELVEVPLSAIITTDVYSHYENGALVYVKEDSGLNYTITYEVTVQPQNGTVIQKDDGSWWYRSNFNYMGTDYFTAKATFGERTKYIQFAGSLKYGDDKNISVNVVNSNHAPEIQSQTLTTQEETPLAINLTAYDHEQDNVSFSIDLSSMKNGTIEKVDTTTYTYTPNKDFFGDENITYTANDGTSTSYEAQLNIKVTNINDAPTIEETFHTIEPKPMTEDTTVLYDYETMSVSQQSKAYDVEDDKLTFMVVSAPKNGKVKIHENGGYVYVPNFGYAGEDSFGYKAYDGELYSDIATVTIDIK
ncbi:MAG: Ig-like domain-containing protein, partial [Campylobacterota bacterium]|nr:Ig-like domain-containing protein [Campylobacterota bacterium]